MRTCEDPTPYDTQAPILTYHTIPVTTLTDCDCELHAMHPGAAKGEVVEVDDSRLSEPTLLWVEWRVCRTLPLYMVAARRITAHIRSQLADARPESSRAAMVDRRRASIVNQHPVGSLTPLPPAHNQVAQQPPLWEVEATSCTIKFAVVIS